MQKFYFIFLFVPWFFAPLFVSTPRSAVIIDGQIYPYRMGFDLDGIHTTILNPQEAVEKLGEVGKNGALVCVTDAFLAEHDMEDAYVVTGVMELSFGEKILWLLRIFTNHYLYFGIPLLLLLLVFGSLFWGNRIVKKDELESADAGLGRRLCTYVIDSVLSNAVLVYVGWIVVTGWPLFTYYEVTDKCYFFCLALLWKFAYFYLPELYLGRTIGKLFSRSHVVVLDGKPRSTALAIRTLCRLIPLEEYSFLFNASQSITSSPHFWHDILSHTRVVKG